MVPTPKIERVDNFLRNDNVRRNMPVLNKSRLSIVNETRKVRFESICQRLSDDFVNNVAQTDWSKVLWNYGLHFLGDESNMSFVKFSIKNSSSVEILYQGVDIISYPRPGQFIEGSVESVSPRGGIAAHVFDDGVKLRLV